MTPNLANDPAVQAALRLNQIHSVRVRFKDRLLLVVPLPAGCYFLVKGLLLAGDAGNDPSMALAGGLIKGLEFMGGFVCFYLSLRAYFKIRRARKGTNS